VKAPKSRPINELFAPLMSSPGLIQVVSKDRDLVAKHPIFMRTETHKYRRSLQSPMRIYTHSNRCSVFLNIIKFAAVSYAVCPSLP